MTEINIACPKCRSRFKISEEHIGKKGRCQKCGERFLITVPPTSKKPTSSNVHAQVTQLIKPEVPADERVTQPTPYESKIPKRIEATVVMKKVKKWFYVGGWLGGHIAFWVFLGLAIILISDFPRIGLSLAQLSTIALAFAIVVGMTLLYKMWAVIAAFGGRTTPSKAVWFLFIPYFNLYWIFQAIWGWTKDYNKICKNHDINLPRMPEGLALVISILRAGPTFVALTLLLIRLLIPFPKVFGDIDDTMSLIIFCAIACGIFNVILLSAFYAKACTGINALIETRTKERLPRVTTAVRSRMSLVGMICLVLVAGILSTCQSSSIVVPIYLSKSPKKFIKDGDTALNTARQVTDKEVKEQEYKRAERNYHKARALAKTNSLKIEILFKLVDMYMEADQWRNVLGCWNMIVQIDPKNIKARFGRFQYVCKMADSTVNQLWAWQEVESQASELIEVVENGGLLMEDTAKFEYLQMKNTATDIKQLGPYLYQRRGRASLEIARLGAATDPNASLTKAISDLERSRELEPNNVDTDRYLAQALIIKGENRGK
jgi:predicted Zn finger-like uncharacterized protein